MCIIMLKNIYTDTGFFGQSHDRMIAKFINSEDMSYTDIFLLIVGNLFCCGRQFKSGPQDHKHLTHLSRIIYQSMLYFGVP